MSDTIYTSDSEYTNHNHVTIAQACRGVLAKRFLRDGSVTTYDLVKHYNFFEQEVDSLRSLYTLCMYLVDRQRCCIIRARVKDLTKKRHVRRLCNGEDATLILSKFNWFAIDIDNFPGYTGDLLIDSKTVLMELPVAFRGCEYFAMASASYGIKQISIRMFFWSDNPVSNTDLKKMFKGTCVDVAIFNPIQLIYTARPIFDVGMIDPIENRIAWNEPMSPKKLVIPSYADNQKGDPEKWYTKQQAIVMIEKAYLKIEDITPGRRHDELRDQCYFLGKLVGQGHFDKDEVIERAFAACDEWTGSRNTAKDMETIKYGIARGIESMDRGVNE
jgi:hypothetical protein